MGGRDCSGREYICSTKTIKHLPLLAMGHETVLAYVCADNFDHNIEKQQDRNTTGKKDGQYTHLMAFQETIEDTHVFHNTNDDYQVPCTKRRRVKYEPGDVPNPIINKSEEPPNFDDIKPISPKHLAPCFSFGFASVNAIHMTKLLQH